jgi:exopolysaccharide biosynthesis polyprenyl glycosylphosphotransferase
LEHALESDRISPATATGQQADGALPHRPDGKTTILSSRWTRRDSAVRRLLAIADVLGLVIAMAIVSALVPQASDRFSLLLATLPTIPVWILLFKLYGLYDRDLKRTSHTALDDLPWLFHALLIGTLLLWAYTKVIPVHQLTLLECALFGPLSVFLIAALRSGARRTATRALGPERLLIIGNGEPILALLRRIQDHAEYEPIGLITGDKGATEAEVGVPILGTPSQLLMIASELKPDRMVISRRGLRHEEILEFVEASRLLSVKVSVLPGVVDALGTSVEVDQIDGITILGTTPPVLARSSRLVKRGFDIIVSTLLLLLFVPTMLVAAIAIKLDSRGPALFRQRRIGKRGEPFTLMKLRTMVHGAEKQRTALMAQSRDMHWLHLEHDPRVTRVGRLLRLTSLDEVPQLWNVLRGDMSLVGPRPLPEEEDRQIAGWMRGRLDLTPGMTGMWQVLGRTKIPFMEMVKLDYLYVTNWSLWTDITLLLRTAPVLVRRRGAN